MLKIKLTRTGRRNAPSYRIIVTEARSKINGRAVDSLGSYNPHEPTNKLLIDKDRYANWLKKGAQPSNTIRLLVARTK